jgi:RimJ/RimL family protein N-acetyltransferase
MSDEITLRQITDSLGDAIQIVRWRNDPANARWFPKQPPWTVEGHQQWFTHAYQRDPSQNVYFVRRDGCPIGLVGMTISKGSGELERMILGDKRLARGGYMRQGMRQLMEAYGLAHYWLRVMPDNETTIRFHKRNGFTVTGDFGGEYENVNGERGTYLVMSRSFDGYWPEVPVK